MSLSAFIIQHPAIYLYAAPVVALTALSTTPSFVPLTLLLTILHLHVHTLLPRGQAASHGTAQVLLLSLATSLAHLKASLHALSTPAVSIVVLAALSSLTSLISLSAISASYYINRFSRTPWSKLTVFPAVWATIWGAVAYASPVGRLVTWSPVLGLGPYNWTRPILGQWGIDWIVAAWAVVCAETIGNWLVGSAQGELDDALLEQEQAVSFTSGDISSAGQPVQSISRSASPQPRHILLLTSMLIVLAMPSFFLSSFPAPQVSKSTTPLSVGCVLPYRQRSGKMTRALTLDDFIHESSTLQSSTDIILWPEGAVRFDTSAQKDEAFQKIMSVMNNKKLFGIGFEEFILAESSNGTRRAGMRRNGFTLLSKGGPVLEYYKRMLVPIAESFSLTPSSDPPSIYTWEMENPKDWAKTKWGPPPNYTRPITLTASICLDFSSSSSFSSLESRPALILAPARTWHIGIGYAMWEQARARAEELGSMVLWCDGGEGGVSGVAGGGMHEFVQVGQGSWSKRIGIQWPFDQGRTVFSLGGGRAALVTVWGIVGVGSILEVAMLTFWGRSHRIGSGSAWMMRRIRGLGEMVRGWRLVKRDEERPLLE